MIDRRRQINGFPIFKIVQAVADWKLSEAPRRRMNKGIERHRWPRSTSPGSGVKLTSEDDGVTWSQVTEFDAQSRNRSCSVADLPRHWLQPVAGLFWIALNEGEMEIRSWMLALYGLAGHLAQKKLHLPGGERGSRNSKGELEATLRSPARCVCHGVKLLLAPQQITALKWCHPAAAPCVSSGDRANGC